MKWESDSDGTWRLIDADGMIQATVWQTGKETFMLEYHRDWLPVWVHDLDLAKRLAVEKLMSWHQRAIDELKALATNTEEP